MTQSRIKITKIEKVDRLNYLETFHIHYLSKSGKARIWEFISRKGIQRLEDEIENNTAYTDGPTVFAVDKTRTKVALVKEFRVGAGNYMYALPAGLIDKGESIEEAAIREFKEETGLDLSIEHVAPPRYTSVGLSNERVNMVYGYFTGTPSNVLCEDSEDIEVVIVDKEEVGRILETCEVPIRTAIALESFFKLNTFF